MIQYCKFQVVRISNFQLCLLAKRGIWFIMGINDSTYKFISEFNEVIRWKKEELFS